MIDDITLVSKQLSNGSFRALPQRFYFQVQHPALAGRPYSGAIADFTDRAILAYECGYSEVDLREQLEHTLLAGASGLTCAHAKVVWHS